MPAQLADDEVRYVTQAAVEHSKAFPHRLPHILCFPVVVGRVALSPNHRLRHVIRNQSRQRGTWSGQVELSQERPSSFSVH